ncbi:hypothetical protein BHM03_00031956 [Ensete ventricosum]|nr:hypothetical protein BHM03_00031956 [Ensete ventricosum]
MGSETPSEVAVHITGFGRFHGVPENPTEGIVAGLLDFMQDKGLPQGLRLGSCSVLETAGEGALAPLYRVLESAVPQAGADPGRVIWVNEVFVVALQTALPVDDIVNALAKRGYLARTSLDAGRFVCNYVYYHSLWLAEQHGFDSLFVHVPPFETINRESQMRFVACLLDVLASLP